VRVAAAPAIPVAAPKKETFTMEIINGNKKNEMKFEKDGEGK